MPGVPEKVGHPRYFETIAEHFSLFSMSPANSKTQHDGLDVLAPCPFYSCRNLCPCITKVNVNRIHP